MSHLRFPSIVLVSTLLALPAGRAVLAQSVPARVLPDSATAGLAFEREAPPLRLAESLGLEPLASLAEASEGAADGLAAIGAWNSSGGRPLRTGLVRPLAGAREVGFSAAMLVEPAGFVAGGAYLRSGAEHTVWGGEVEVRGAHRLRLRLDGVHLPAGARLWVYGENGAAAGPFGTDLMDAEGGLWTPSVAGSRARLEVELPDSQLGGRGRFGFTLERVLEIFRLGRDGIPVTNPAALPATKGVDFSCLEDATCFTSSTFSAIADVRPGIGQLSIISGPFSFVCSGGLLNDTVAGSDIPYLLTANHCLSTASEAASLEVLWDFKTTSCEGSTPDPDDLPMSNGSTLLATGTVSDFTLVRLSSIPGGRTLLGWNANASAVPNNTVVHRISHPAPTDFVFPQAYTRNTLGAVRFFCGTDEDGRDLDDPSDFLHSRATIGGSFGGSSGSPLMLANGQVVGQLLGACGQSPEDGCDDDSNDTLDGAFSRTFPFVSSFLAPPAGGGDPAPPSGTWLTTTAIPGFRFQVRIGGTAGILGAKQSDCVPETFCASGAIAGRSEIFIRIVGPKPNGFLWPTLVKFTTSEVEFWIEQTATGLRQYYQLEGAAPGVDELPGLFDREGFVP
jgi:hypothetical protein